MKNGNKMVPEEEIHFTFADNEALSAEALFQLAEQSYTTGSPWSRIGFEQDLKHPHANYLIATSNEKLIGYIGYHQVLDEVEIMNVVVGNSFQQQGIASRLMQQCLEKLVSEPVHQVFLEVRKSNQAAVRLYQKNRFAVIGERKHYYTHPQEDALIMQKKIEQENV